MVYMCAIWDTNADCCNVLVYMYIKVYVSLASLNFAFAPLKLMKINGCFFLQIMSGGIIMLMDASESQDGPEELIEPLKGELPLSLPHTA